MRETAMLRIDIGPAAIELVLGDITRQDTRAIVNAANPALVAGGGVDGAIHRAAGPGLSAELQVIRQSLPGCLLSPGSAVMTSGYALTARYVIHCVGPIHAREGRRAPELLASVYREALRLCREHDVDSVAFPSVGTGAYGFPVEPAAEIALATVRLELATWGHPLLVRFVLFDEGTFDAYRRPAAALPSPGPEGRP